MKRILGALLCVLLVLSLCCCVKLVPDKGGFSETSEEGSESVSDSTPATEYVYAAKDGEPLMSVIYSVKASDSATLAAQNFFSRVYETTGIMLSTDQDYVDAVDAEILIGDTNRPETQALKEALVPYGFAIRASGTKLVIVAWDDECLLAAVEYFFSDFLPQEGVFENGTFCVRSGAEYVSAAVENTAFFDAIRSSDTLKHEVGEHLFTMEKPGNTTWPQGGCVHDGYFYQAFVRKDTASNEANNDVIIVKYDLETGALVQQSEVLDLNHCNDITYNSKLGYFVVCHNNPNRTYVSYVDPETLTVVDTVQIEDRIYSIDYNEATDRYVIGLSGGQSFCFLNGDLSKVDYMTVYPPTTRTAGCVTQSVTTDEEFIYFVLYKPNVIAVYDWEGNFVSLIELSIGSIEPESITVVRNVFYIGCGTSGGCKVYKIASIVPAEK